MTVHLIDTGIDTGNILLQQKIEVTAKDNFATYPYLQLGVGLHLLNNAIPAVLEDTISIKYNNLSSALWHHPTLWQYLSVRLKKGVK